MGNSIDSILRACSRGQPKRSWKIAAFELPLNTDKRSPTTLPPARVSTDCLSTLSPRDVMDPNTIVPPALCAIYVDKASLWVGLEILISSFHLSSSAVAKKRYLADMF